jgi:tetratricopeptide (TPR) repeat protein
MFNQISSNFMLIKYMEKIAGMVSDWRSENRNFSSISYLRLAGIMLLLFFICTPAAYGKATLSDPEKKELYRQGTEYFRQATAVSESDPEAASDLYAKALLRLERLVDEGNVKNGKLIYNIGNIYFLLDDIGRAILNYRRAEQFIPNDPNLVKNLSYARSMRQDELDIKDQEKILQTLFFFHYDLGIQTRLILFGIFYLSLWMIAAIKIFSKRPFTSWVLGFTFLFTLLFGGSLFVESKQSSMNTIGVVLSPEVIGRQGDAESYQTSFEESLHAGTEFTLLEDRGAWWQIELPDGRSSWIPAKTGEMVKK